MYCPNCGIADQNPDSYCRNCGKFLLDPANKLNHVFKLFGISTPEKQINLNLVFNLVSAIFSLILLVFLIGYFEAGANRNPPVETPVVFYLVGAFLLFTALWQILGFVLNLGLKIKSVNKNQRQYDTERGRNEMSAAETAELLPPADLQNVVPSATEETTRNLVKEKRK